MWLHGIMNFSVLGTVFFCLQSRSHGEAGGLPIENRNLKPQTERRISSEDRWFRFMFVAGIAVPRTAPPTFVAVS